MFGMPIQEFSEFLVFVVPGFLYIKTRRYFRPAKKESSFFEILNTRDITRIEFIEGVKKSA